MKQHYIFDTEKNDFKILTCDSVIIHEFNTRNDLEKFLALHPYSTYIISETNPYKVHFAQFELLYFNGSFKTTKLSYTMNPFNKNYETEYNLLNLKNDLVKQLKEIEEIEKKYL